MKLARAIEHNLVEEIILSFFVIHIYIDFLNKDIPINKL